MALKRPPSAPARPIDDHTVLTQYGRQAPGRPTFRSGPRPDRDHYQSMTAGRRTADEMARLVMRRHSQSHDWVRYTTAAKLRAAGFVVLSKPSPWNADHVSVSLPGGSVPWDDDMLKAFESCFEGDGSGCT